MKIFSQTTVINLMLLLGMVVLGVCGIFAFIQIEKLVATNKWVLHTGNVINVSNNILLDITEGESRLNYFLISKNKAAIAQLPQLANEAQQNLSALKQLTKDNPIQSIRVKELEKIANDKAALMLEIAKIASDSNNKTNLHLAIRLATGQKRLALKEDLAQAVTDINEEEVNLLEQRNNAAIQEIRTSHLTFLVFGVFSELLIIFSLILLNYNLHQRNLARQKQNEAEKLLLESNRRLQESDERYLLATEGSSAGLWDWEVGTDKVFYSSYFKKMLGYSDAEFPDTLESFERVIHPNDHNRLWEMINEHLKRQVPFKIEYRLRTKSGVYNWFEAAGLALWDKQGVPIRMSGSVIDITDRKKAEQRLRIQFAVTEVLSDAKTLEEACTQIIKIICESLVWDFGEIWMVDNECGLLRCVGAWHQPSPILKLFAEESCQQTLAFGVGSPGRIWKLAKPVWFRDIDQDQSISRTDLVKASGLKSALGFPIIVERQVLGVIQCFTQGQEEPDERLLDLMMTIGFQVGIFITRKGTENDLRESEAYNAAVLESATDSIITINEKKEIISINPQTVKEFHYSKEELINQNIDIIIPTFNVEVRELSNKISIDTLGLRKDGESFAVELKISRIIIEKETMSVIFLRDITERKKIEKLKNEFVSVVSHELRTPLTSIRGALGLVLGGTAGELSEKIHKLLDLANNNCERLLLLINDILDIEKIEAGKMNFDFKVVDMSELVKEAMTANAIFAKKYNVKLELIETASYSVNVDSARLIQVLTNLISNAVKFSPEGETVTLAITKQRNNVRILVSNKGAGIPIEFQSKIFQKFSQADSSDTRVKGGTGLGLNISKAIIEKLGGTLNFISKPNEMTTFYFDLPIWHDVAHAEKEKKIVEPGVELSKEKILICEDDENQAKYVAKLLESAGFKIDIAYTVKSAKEFLDKNKYEVLLLDLILPDQDGIAFIRELRSIEATKRLPIIVLSVIAQTGKSLLNGETFAVMDWLDKPIDFHKLLHAIEQIKQQTYPKLPNVLHVEDDVSTLEIVRTLLENHANVISAMSIRETEEKLKNFKFDLLILDLLLPDGNAERILPLLSNYKIPVIIYSALELDKTPPSVVKHVLLKSETTNEKLLNLIKRVLETST